MVVPGLQISMMAPTHPNKVLMKKIADCFFNEVLPLQPTISRTNSSTLLELRQLLYTATDASIKETLIKDFFQQLCPGFIPVWRTSPRQQEVHIYGDSNMEKSSEIHNLFSDSECMGPNLRTLD